LRLVTLPLKENQIITSGGLSILSRRIRPPPFHNSVTLTASLFRAASLPILGHISTFHFVSRSVRCISGLIELQQRWTQAPEVAYLSAGFRIDSPILVETANLAPNATEIIRGILGRVWDAPYQVHSHLFTATPESSVLQQHLYHKFSPTFGAQKRVYKTECPNLGVLNRVQLHSRNRYSFVEGLYGNRSLL